MAACGAPLPNTAGASHATFDTTCRYGQPLPTMPLDPFSVIVRVDTPNRYGMTMPSCL